MACANFYQILCILSLILCFSGVILKQMHFGEFWTTLRRNPVIVSHLRSEKVSNKTIKPFGNVRPTEIQGY